MEIDLNKFKLDKNKEELNINEITYLDTLSQDQIKELINYCDKQYNYFNAMQNALKLILNSVYGAFGNEFFVCSTKEIAGAITAMGRDIIKYMDHINETYLYDFLHLDTEIHELLGVTDVKQIDSRYIHTLSKNFITDESELTDKKIEEGEYQRYVPVSNYCDTDSLFVSFQPAMNSCGLTKSEQEFITIICKKRLEPLFKKKLNGYAKKFKVENIHDFELENINESILFLAKKTYIKHTILEDGTQYDRLKNIVPKGVDLIKKGTPKFARDNVYKIIEYLFNNSKTYTLKDLLKFVRDLKKEFELTAIEEITKSTNINNYLSSKIMVPKDPKNHLTTEMIMIDGPGVVEDKEKLIYGKGTYFMLKAAGLYNHLLHQHPELINDYELITPGTKVRLYPCKHDLNDKFCFPIGKFPKEFAPEVDFDELFQKTVADQVNTYIHALGLPELNKRLKIVMSLF